MTEKEFEFVEISDAPSPAPAPPGRPYTEVVEDYRSGEKVSKTFEVNGIHFFIKNSKGSKNVKKMMMSHGGCRICTRRTHKFFSLIGEDGPVFLENIVHPTDGCTRCTLFNIRQEVVKESKTLVNPSIFFVEGNSFPPVEEGKDEKTNKSFEHITILPDNISDNLSWGYKDFINENVNVCQTRLSNLFNTEAQNSLRIIKNNLGKLTRKDHWVPVFEWIEKIQSYLTKPYEYLSSIEKIKLGIFAITTGRIDCDTTTYVNKDFRQSSNLVDFVTMESIEDILREMDSRSDPATYMRSQLERNLMKHSCSSKYRISLVWDGKIHKDDLDLQLIWTTPDNQKYKVYYRQTKVDIRTPMGETFTTRLDFDANAGEKIDEPAENFTCVPYGNYLVQVNNFARYTKGKDIPFTVIIHQEGNEDIIFERTWSADRNSGCFMDITTHQFTKVENPDLIMSTKAASRSIANKDEWDEYFGENIVSIVPTMNDLDQDTPINIWDKPNGSSSDSFMDLANKSVEKKKKKYLSQKGHLPQNMNDLMVYMSSGKHRLMIKPRGKNPGYITKIITKKEVQKTKYSLNHFHTKGEIPRKPGESGTARFDTSWFHDRYVPSEAEVECAIQFGKNWFLVVKGTCLPYRDSNYPLSGGFHTGKLKPSLHSKHNYQWTYNNTKILPTISQSDGIPLIGTFLTNEVELVLNGKSILVNTN